MTPKHLLTAFPLQNISLSVDCCLQIYHLNCSRGCHQNMSTSYLLYTDLKVNNAYNLLHKNIGVKQGDKMALLLFKRFADLS